MDTGFAIPVSQHLEEPLRPAIENRPDSVTPPQPAVERRPAIPVQTAKPEILENIQRTHRPPAADTSRNADWGPEIASRLEIVENSIREQSSRRRIDPGAQVSAAQSEAVSGRPGNVDPGPRVLAPAAPPPPLPPQDGSEPPAGNTIRIGAIDVYVAAPTTEPAPRPAAPVSSLSRGFVATFGLRQG
jgi:hypothetical protein